MPGTSKLMRVRYYDAGAEIRLSSYSDTLIWENERTEKILRAVRLGEYPEMVRALADAIYGGAGVEVEISGQRSCLNYISAAPTESSWKSSM